MNPMKDKSETQGLLFYSCMAVDVTHFDSQPKWLIYHYNPYTNNSLLPQSTIYL